MRSVAVPSGKDVRSGRVLHDEREGSCGAAHVATICARCGVRAPRAPEHGFRYYRNGIAYCDECWPQKGPWIIGPSAFARGGVVYGDY